SAHVDLRPARPGARGGSNDTTMAANATAGERRRSLAPGLYGALHGYGPLARPRLDHAPGEAGRLPAGGFEQRPPLGLCPFTAPGDDEHQKIKPLRAHRPVAWLDH